MTAQPAEQVEQPARLGLADMIRGFQVAMTDEGVSEATIRRVVNRLVYGHPDGPQGVHRIVDVQEAPQIHIHFDGPPPGMGAHRLLALQYARRNAMTLRTR